ncbi:MAG: aldose 1-epimerase [Solirubrobacteraceae bacterium]|jgi:galactose mutarotase-like enzyme|nr:aldose 1-epimerase [Solirubrobacteraceae bacterium]
MNDIVLSAGDLQATFVPKLSMVGSSLRHREDELLGVRGGLAAWGQRGKTMGIPMLHPWANRLSGWDYTVAGTRVDLPRGSADIRTEEHGLPIHGLMHGNADWTVVESSATEVRAELDFGADNSMMRLFPFAHTLALHAVLDPIGLQLNTTMTATGDLPVPVSFGYHPYLQLPGVARRDWNLECTVSQHLVLDSHSVPTGEVRNEPVATGPLGDRTFDDGYQSADGAWMRLSGGGWTVDTRFLEGYTHAQLFAPRVEDLISFEPMTAPSDALRTGRGLRTLAPGESFSAAFRIDVYR